MLRIILHGCMGQMGLVLTNLVQTEQAAEIVAGVDSLAEGERSYPVFSSVAACDAAADVVIDFSAARAADALLADCVSKSLPLVFCTTGLSAEQNDRLLAASEKIPVLRSANMSLGINLLLKLVRDAAPALKAAGFDIEIVEKHHRRKLDAPSGTALALADAAKEAVQADLRYVYDRTGRSMQRDPEEIGISAVRGGSIVGEHDVIFAGQDEVLTLSHSAYSRAIFAKGALAAAHFLKGRPAGLYDMSDVISKGQ